eukprot:1906148-Prymnesium_polylepis.1
MPCCRCAENATSCRPKSRRVSAASPAKNLRQTSRTRRSTSAAPSQRAMPRPAPTVRTRT